MPSLNTPFFTKGLPTILFSFVGLATLNSFLSGNNDARSLSNVSKTEREDRLDKEKALLVRKVEKLEDEREKELANSKGGYDFGKRVPRN